MNSLQSVVGTPIGYILYFAACLLAIVLLAIMLRLVRERRNRGRFAVVLLHFVFVFFFLCVLLNYSYNAVLEARPEVLKSFELRLLALPWFLAAALELISAAAVFWHVRFLRIDWDTHLTPDAIRQTVDRLPTGLLFAEPDGTVLLTNPIMTKLCRELTGELLSDAGRLWQFVEKEAPERLIYTKDGETWQFKKDRIVLDGREYVQITAVDMTEQYRITRQLSQMNRHLKEVQERMKAVAAKERSLVAEREIMNARMTVHNRMGAVLLSGKYYLDHPENVKEEELLRLLEFNSHFLIGEAEQPESEADPLQEAIHAAGRIGVRVELQGAVPEMEVFRRVIARAVEQCAANAVRHAGGDLLQVVISERADGMTVMFSNNGRPPAGPITETGGLADLRKTVEEAGGGMTIQSEPAFLLTILIPNQIRTETASR